jgi:hypothetical protein
MSDAPTALTVKLTPNAAKNEIQGWIVDAGGKPILKVRVTATPEKLKANDALVALLAKTWNIPPSSITIIKGATDRLKTLHITADISTHLKDERHGA